MTIHPGRLALVLLALAEIGALAGALVCWLFLLGWTVLAYGLPEATSGIGQLLAGSVLWAGLVGGPVGAVALPVLGLTVLRRVAVGRALGFALLGAVAGLLVAAAAVPAGSIWPVPALVPVLGFGGLLTGASAARVPSLRLGRGRGAGHLRGNAG